ncbi:MAG: hypothetical protein RBR40_14850 [Tenuifilaceae bacterium]|nr:hypothetical protein [Tenuifilaceae bacterium]
MSKHFYYGISLPSGSIIKRNPQLVPRTSQLLNLNLNLAVSSWLVFNISVLCTLTIGF